MPEHVLHAEARSDHGTKAARRVRRSGRLPAVLYGHEEAAQSLAVPYEDFEAVLHAGTRMVDLEMEGATQKVLIKEVQHDPLGDRLLHVDFVRVAMDERVEIEVPLEVHGTAAGVKAGGTLDVLLHEVTIECLPGDIPEVIRVRVTDLEINDTIHLGDVPLPEGVRLLDEPETPVVVVHPPKAEEEAAAPEEGPTAPEVITREAAEETEAGPEA